MEKTAKIKIKVKEKVVYLADDLTSIMTLKDLIEDIRNNRLENFIIMAQTKSHGETVLTRGIPLDDPLSSGKILKYYFFGDDSTSYHLGLCHRMSHLLNQYMDGVDIFGDYEEGEEEYE